MTDPSQLPTRTPASLLERLKRPDDHGAWERLVKLYAPMIYGWACSRGLGESEAADLVQDVFLKLLQELPTFRYDRQRSFRAWLKTVTLNQWRENLRRLRHRPERLADEDVPDENGAEAFAIFEEGEYRRQLVHRAMKLIENDFEPATWEMWRQYVVSRRPASEVATQLGVTVNTVYLAKSRILRRLRQELDGLFGD